MSEKIMLQVPLNRVEGDLEIRVELDDGVVSDAWSSGIMYRGFEKLLKGRAALDGLVITPRICGICGTAHLTAAARALEMIQGVEAPPAANRMRAVALMVEKIQSDLRHAFLMFATDFVNPAYQAQPLYETAVERYAPLKGETVRESLLATKELVEIIAIIGGQWPHSSYMIPGGLTAMPNGSDLLQCRLIISRFKKWYEKRVLGCTLDRWLQIRSASDLDAWLEESPSHLESEMGFYIRFCRATGLETIGRGHETFLSYGGDGIGQPSVPPESKPGIDLFQSGVAQGIMVKSFDQQQIAEYVDYSWYRDYEGGRHPSRGETEPYATGEESRKYSWAKAPRYADRPAETGPLSEMIIAQDPLFCALMSAGGANVYLRELARLARPVHLITAVEDCLKHTTGQEAFYIPVGPIKDGEGYGLAEATRGGLGHWVAIEDGTIRHYQVITPTAWNASPRDANGIRGPWEEALIGTPVSDPRNPVELGHVIRSFDACLFCTVHVIDLTDGTADHNMAV